MKRVTSEGSFYCKTVLSNVDISYPDVLAVNELVQKYNHITHNMLICFCETAQRH